MKLFMSDMKLMYKVLGKRLLKEFVKIQLIVMLFAGVMLYGLDFSFIESLLILIMPMLAFILAYLSMYFGEYRTLFKRIRIEVKLEDKYEGLLRKFMRTY
ncbi:hypothetical protein CVD28_02805 [Bacillus sp. M6-12]|uniref:hypothetical protein n=1 Tax=Bacillus sp. M6-12 TaxID=2054166 RepID=UPI000C76302D|nr:hypothetical protein [Bacillus sp. M6-12]PLS19362.1 hypothetical protein CVD28_02805 [Bacillus sp. M6-12]